MVHDGRPDFAMLLGLIFLLLTGPGRWSLDAILVERSNQSRGADVGHGYGTSRPR